MGCGVARSAARALAGDSAPIWPRLSGIMVGAAVAAGGTEEHTGPGFSTRTLHWVQTCHARRPCPPVPLSPVAHSLGPSGEHVHVVAAGGAAGEHQLSHGHQRGHEHGLGLQVGCGARVTVGACVLTLLVCSRSAAAPHHSHTRGYEHRYGLGLKARCTAYARGHALGVSACCDARGLGHASCATGPCVLRCGPAGATPVV